ncbi:hypothetical protein JCM8547_008308 [Rhodosporidiobolus lusitaniae]
MPRSESYSSKEKLSEDADKTVTVARVEPDEAQLEEENVDQVFGEVGTKDTVNFRGVGWKSAAVLMSKSQIGIGVLSVPGSFHVLGLIPGVITLIFFAVITTWSDYYIGIFKIKHPQVYSVSDGMKLVCGPIGEWVAAISYLLFGVFVGGSAFLTLSTALNAISMHGLCTAGFVAIVAVFTGSLGSIRTLEKIRWIGWVGIVSIMSALLTCTIAVAIGGRPSLAPQTGPFDLDVKLWATPSFTEAMGALSTQFWAFTGTSSFLSIASEMRDPKDFPKAVISCQVFVTAVYTTVGVVVYAFAGQYVASPALGTAGVLIKRISYGLSLPGLVFTAVFFIHLPAKWLFLRILRGSHHISHPTKTHYFTWFSCTIGCTLTSYIIASAIPVFDGLVGLIGASTGVILSLHCEALFFLYDYRYFFQDKSRRTPLLWFGIVFNIFLLVIGTFLFFAGSYGSIASIAKGFNGGTRPFSCADNSGSV